MSAWKCERFVNQFDQAFFWARITTEEATRVLAILSRSGTWLQALDCIVQWLRVATCYTRVTASQAAVACGLAAALRRELQEMIGLRHGYDGVRVTWAT